MRLFIAIAFDKNVKQELADFTAKLRLKEVKGRFMRTDNFHLTLSFLGETKKRQAIERALEKLEGDAFSLTLQHLGQFQRQRGNILWLDVQENLKLRQLHKNLIHQLDLIGFPPDKRSYNPHITLGRNVTFPKDKTLESFASLSPLLHQPVEAVTLMKSHHVNGILTYTPLYSKRLG